MTRSIQIKYLKNRLFSKDILEIIDLPIKQSTQNNYKFILKKVMELLENTEVCEIFTSVKILEERYVEPLSNVQIRSTNNILELLSNEDFYSAYIEMYNFIYNAGRGTDSYYFVNINEYYVLKMIVEQFIKKIDSNVIKYEVV